MAERPHREMCTFIETIFMGQLGRTDERVQRRGMLLVPRGCLKTTLASVAFPIYALVHNPNLRILIDTHKQEFSREILYDIKWHFMNNERLQQYIGNWSDGAPRWAEDSIIVNKRSIARKEPSIGTSGVDLAKTGGHYDIIIMDDIVSEINVQGARGRRAVERHFRNLIPILEPTGSEMLIGTRFSPFDLFGQLLTDDAKRRAAGQAVQFETLVRSCWNNDGSPYYPSVLTKEVLAQKRLDLGDWLFSSYYLNNPISDKDRTFSRERIQLFEGSLSSSPDGSILEMTKADGTYALPVRVSMAIDPATTAGERSDFTGITVVATDENGVSWVVEADAFKGVPSETVARIVSLASIYRPSVISIEANAAQGLFIPLITPALQAAGIPTTVQPWKPARLSKGIRIEALQPALDSGNLRIRSGLQALLDQLLDYSPVIPLPHDDLIDALSQNMGVLSPPDPAGSVRVGRVSFWDRLAARYGKVSLEDFTDGEKPAILDGTWTGRGASNHGRT